MIRPFTFPHTPSGMTPERRLCSSALEVVPISSARRDSSTLSTSSAAGSSRICGCFVDMAVSMPRLAAEGCDGLQSQFVAERNAKAGSVAVTTTAVLFGDIGNIKTFGCAAQAE